MMTKRLRYIAAAVVVVATLILVAIIAAPNLLVHGHYFDNESTFMAYLESFEADTSDSESLDASEQGEGAITAASEQVEVIGLETIDLLEDPYETTLSPGNTLINGVEFYLADIPDDTQGFLIVRIEDGSGKIVYDGSAQISQIEDDAWWRFQFDSILPLQENYRLSLFVTEASAGPSLVAALLREGDREEINQIPFVAYSYAQEVLNDTEKMVIILFALVFCATACSLLLLEADKRRRAMKGCLLLFAILLLTATYSLDLLSYGNESFLNGYRGSEPLVTSPMLAIKHGLMSGLGGGFSLGSYVDGEFVAYTSQVGLQGRVFCILGQWLPLGALHLLCCLTDAVVFVVISYLLAKKYNKLLGGIFYVTFWLSPWIIAFAENLYWVEFTWFVPMLIGIVLVYRFESARARIICYFATYVSVLVKCLCGYEFLSTILICLIAFPVVELARALCARNKVAIRKVAISILILGIVAVAAFVTALILHAQIRGGGDVLAGLTEIIQKDAAKRMGGADPNVFNTIHFKDSFNASLWETLQECFSFKYQVIIGIEGNLFPILCVAPLAIFLIEAVRGKADVTSIVMYVVFFLATVSWFVLSKSHSYAHSHLVHILWYMGFVQTCIYVICNKFIRFLKPTERMSKDFNNLELDDSDSTSYRGGVNLEK